MEIIGALIIGLLAGWLGSLIYTGSGLGFIGNLVVGLFGSLLGFWLFGKLGISLGTGWIGAILTGAIGAVIILFLLNLIFGKRRS
ncbi:MAG: GlsB/YeaQ/YmgE family stress response membrane protein [Bacteroidales bacterium]